MDIDEAYEYNAPQFMDFLQPQEDHDVEDYFNYDHENGAPVNLSSDVFTTPDSTPALRTPTQKTPRRASRSNTPLTAAALKDSNTPRRSSRLKNTPKATPVQEKENVTEASPPKPESKESSKTNVPSNICTNLEDWNKRKASTDAQNKRPMTASSSSNKTAPVAKTSSLRIPVLGAQRMRKTSVGTDKVTPEVPAAKRVKRSNSTASLMSRPGSTERPSRLSGAQRVKPADPAHSRSLSASRHARTQSASHSRTRSVEQHPPGKDKEKTQPKKHKMTIPITPAVLRRDMSTSAGDKKTAEERELDEMKRLRRELAEKRRRAEESRKMAQSGPSHLPTRAVPLPTKAEGFQFATDQRVKGQAPDVRKTKDDTDFASQLRHHQPSSPARSAPKRTIPAPFHLHEDKKRKRDDEESTRKFKSMAEQITAFSRTPDRFRSKPANKERSPAPKKIKENRLTVPKTPNFETRRRTRSTHVVSQAEIEEKEIEDMKKNQFKAHGVKEDIFKKPTGIPKVPAKEVTQFAEFDLESNRRGRDHRANTSTEEEHYTFQANPVPKKILEKPVGVKPVERAPLTKPASPAFALKNRIRSIRQQVEESCQPAVSSGPRAKAVPHLGLPFQPRLDHKVTESQPFSFEERDRRAQRLKEEKVQKILEEERKMREFRANPMPSDSPDALPARRSKRPTHAEPFQLESDERGAHRVEEMEHKLEEEERSIRQQAVFKARPATSIYKQPFVPKKSMKSLTDDSQAFELSTEQRRERWAELERDRYERQAEMDLQQREAEQRRQEQERAELRKLRQETVHHAKGIRHFKNVEIKPSSMPLTQPSTPRFSERLKNRSANTTT